MEESVYQRLQFQRFGKHGSRQRSMALYAAIAIYVCSRFFEASRPIPSDTSPPIRPHLLILPKQFHQVFKYMGLWGPSSCILPPWLFFVCLFFVFVFSGQGFFLCSHGCSETHSVGQADFKLTEICLPPPLKCWD